MKVKVSASVCVAAVAVAALLWGWERSEGRNRARSESRAGKGAVLAEAPPCCPPGEVQKRKDVSPSPGGQVACPISGRTVDPNICIVHKDKCIYFCSKACADEFAGRPEEFLKKLRERGVVLSDASACRHLERQTV